MVGAAHSSRHVEQLTALHAMRTGNVVADLSCSLCVRLAFAAQSAQLPCRFTQVVFSTVCHMLAAAATAAAAAAAAAAAELPGPAAA
jgi:hypothetical protein